MLRLGKSRQHLTLRSVAAKHIRPRRGARHEQRKKRAATKKHVRLPHEPRHRRPTTNKRRRRDLPEAPLADMSGTKESIKQAKEWLLQRPEKAETFAKALQKHVMNEPGFQKLLFAVYSTQ